jgi:hypothetical protein
MTDEEVKPATPLTKDTAVEATITSTLSSTPTKLTIVPNWRKVLKTYSFWTTIASALLSLVEIILPFFSLLEPTMSVATYGICMFVLNVSAALFRLIKQHKLWPTDENGSNDEVPK